MHKFLPTLALLSGVSGIAYEVLYVRLISAYIGNIFYVSAALLAIFFLGIAVGSFVANRFVGYLKQIELGIGAYAIALALLFDTLGLSITQWVATLPGPDVLVLPLFVFVVLAIPATAIGFSLPLFALFIENYRSKKQAFNSTYAIYNIGAAASVISIEYLLVWNLGISQSIFCIASINVAIGIVLFFVAPPPRIEANSSIEILKTLSRADRRTFVALGAVSLISGIAQLNLFNLSYNIVGPHNENFALLIGVTLLSISIAAIVVKFSKLTFEHSLLLVMTLTLLSFVFLPEILNFYVTFYVAANVSVAGNVLAKFLMMLFLALPMLFAFSTTIPAIVKSKGIYHAGFALAVSAAGNAVGYLLYLFFVFDYLLHYPVFVVCSILAALTYLWHVNRHRLQRALGCGFVLSLLVYTSSMAWPEHLYHSDYSDKLNSANALSSNKPIAVDMVRKFGNHTTLVSLENGDIELHYNGLKSLIFGKDDLTVLREALLGVVATMFTDRHDRVLVFGLGSGITAGAAANLYRDATVAEINPAMFETAARFEEENDDLIGKNNVSIQLQDGLITLLEHDQEFDTIINTVPTPRFFSANKLWTSNVFMAIKKRMKAGGVFVGWVDSRLGKKGLAILQNTLNSVFPNCLYLYLNSGYQSFVCSKNKLRPVSLLQADRSPVISRILESKNWSGGLDQFVRTLLFRSPRKIPADTGLNTLDKPLLEFVHPAAGDHNDSSRLFMRLLGRDPFDDRIKLRLCEAIKILEPLNKIHVSRWCS